MKAAMPPAFLRFGENVERDGGFTAALRAEDFDYASARDASDAERHVERQYAAVYDLDGALHFVAEAHYRAFAESASYVAERLFQYIFASYCFFLPSFSLRLSLSVFEQIITNARLSSQCLQFVNFERSVYRAFRREFAAHEYDFAHGPPKAERFRRR